MITAKVDMSEFNAAVKQAILHSSRSAVVVVNSQAYHLAKRSMAATKRADRNEIEKTLGRTGTGFKRTKTGKFFHNKKGQIAGRVKIFKEDSYAARIINSIRRKVGKKMLFGQEMERAVKRFVAAAVRSRGFIASGWLWSMQDLVKTFPLAKDGRPVKLLATLSKRLKHRGQRKGAARPARRGDKTPSATIENTALNPKHTRGAHNPIPVAMAGLRIGIRETLVDMKKHLEEKLKKDFKKVSTR